MPGGPEQLSAVLRAGYSGPGIRNDLYAASLDVLMRIRQVLSVPFPPPSAPGEPPHMRSGYLRDSYAAKVEGFSTLVFYSDVEYAPYLEFGTSKMEPRPHLAPTVRAATPAIRDRLASGIASRERGAAGRG